tara:strand:- start:33 stop:752 length:720 start_codon:yes stop_codon:yes gene_type:complete
MHQEKKIKILFSSLYFLVLTIFLTFLFLNFDLKEISSYEFIYKNKEQLTLLKQNKLILLIFSFTIFTIFWVFMLGFGTPIALLAGFIFGKWLGTLLTVFGLSTGALCLYLIGKYFLYELIKNKLYRKYNHLEKLFEKNELLVMIIFRFVGLVPFFIANLLPVIFNISSKNYFIGTLIGILPAIFVMVTLGSGLSNIVGLNQEMPSFWTVLISPEIYLPIVGFIIIFISAIFVKKFFIKK